MSDNINTLILKVLSEGEHYGLDIIKRISEISDEDEIKQPSLYSALRRLEEKGFVESYWEDGEEGGRRHYYKITPMGEDELKLSASMADFKKSRNKDSKINDDTPPFDIDDNVSDESDKNIEPNFDTEEPKDDFDYGSNIEITNFNPYEDDESEETDDLPQEISEDETDVEDEPIFSTNDAPFDDFSEKNNFTPIDETENAEEENEFDFNEGNNVQVEPIINLPPQNEEKVEGKPLLSQNEYSFDNIDYKDILGDLEADNFDDTAENKTKIVETSISSMPSTTSPPADEVKKSHHTKYTQQVAEIFSKKRTKTSSQVPASPTFGIKNTELEEKLTPKDTNSLEEVAQKYSIDNLPIKKSKTKPLQKLVSKNVGYSHIKQDEISIKPYNNKSFAKVNTKKFVCSSKFNILRAFLVAALIFAEIFLCFQYCDAHNLYSTTHYYMYVVWASVAILYLLLSIVIPAKDINKKTPINNLHLWRELGLRTIFACLICGFSIGVYYCCGMTEIFNINYYPIWVFPTIMAINIIISWLIGVFMHLLRIFRA